MKTLFELNPEIERKALANRFAETRRVQVRNVLTPEAAHNMAEVLARGTKWGVAIGAGKSQPQCFRMEDMRTPETQSAVNTAALEAQKATARGEYGYRFAHYPILTAMQEGWDPGSAHEIMLEHINAEPFLDLVREVTGISDLIKADGQATLFAPNNYLGEHTDSHVAEGWEVAYVLNFAPDDWRPDWGGYLLFLDDDGDVIEGFRPRYNALNLFRVPQSHLVSYVPPFASIGRFAVTGWFRTK